KCIVGVLLRQGTKYLRGMWFNQPYIKDEVQRGRRVMFSGNPKLQGVRWEMTHPKIGYLGDDEDVPTGRILPVYSLTEGINQVTMRRVVHGGGEPPRPHIDDLFPQ